MEAAGKRYIWYGKRKTVFRIWNLSDLHWMAKACAEGEIKRDIKEIASDPYSFWLGGGDYLDFIGHTDRRFDADAVAEWVPLKALGDLAAFGRVQLRDLFKPIAHKCLGLIIGNHEKKYEVAMEQESWHAWLCTELNVPRLGYSCLFDVIFCRVSPYKEKVPKLTLTAPPHHSYAPESFRVFVHHGAGYAQTPGGKLNRLVQFMQSFDADLYFIGHVHDDLARKEPAICADATCTTLMQRSRLGLVAGSYLKTYQQGATTYGEQKGYRPTSLGASIATINPELREMEAVV